MSVPALHWNRVIYQVPDWNFQTALGIASNSLTHVGLTNIHTQAADVYAVTPSMIIAVGVVAPGDNIYVLVVMAAGNNASEVKTMVGNVFNYLKSQTPL
jgi:molybdopterin synthase catalytic subunit